MGKILNIFWREPVVTLTITTGAAAALSTAHLIPAWVPLVTLAIVTPIQRALVTPKANGGTNPK